MSSSNLIERLKAIRAALGLNQREFAERMEISTTCISEIEKDKYKPNYEFLVRLVKDFRVNLYYLMFGEGEMFIGEKVATLSKSLAVDEKKMQRFLDRLQKSPILQYYILAMYSSFNYKENEAIEAEIMEYNKKYNLD